MMDPNNYGNLLPPHNYNIPTYSHPIPQNNYYYKEYTPCTTNIPVCEPTYMKVNPISQKTIDQNIIINDAPKLTKTPIKSRRKLGKKELNHKLNQRLRRLRGESYIDSKGKERPARPMKTAPCRGKSKHKECDEISDEDRQKIYNEFHQLKSNQAQWQFIASHLLIHYNKKKISGRSDKPLRREYTHVYYLTAKGHRFRVCKEFFLATLSITESSIRTAWNKLSNQGICQDDKRGRKTPQNKLSEEGEDFIRKHILSFPIFNKKNNLKSYLDSSLSVSKMHKLYVNLCNEQNRKPVSLGKYRLIFKEYGFAFLKQKGMKAKKGKLPNTFKDNNFRQNPDYQTNQIATNYQQMHHEVVNEYHPNAEVLNVDLGNNNANLSIGSYLIGVETAKEYNDKRMPPVERPECSNYYPISSFNIIDNSNINIINKRPEILNPMHEISSMRTLESELNNTQSTSKNILKSRKKFGKKEIDHKMNQRLRRLRGESYIDSKGKERPARPMKPASCRGKPKHKECDEISDEDRQKIYTEFRQLKSNQAQWQFIASHLLIHYNKKKISGRSDKPLRREYIHVYYLTANGDRYRVCKEFFLSTLSITESSIKTAWNKLSNQGICQDDKRGRKTPQNKLSQDDENFIRNHILSFPTCNKKNNSKKYLDAGLSVSKMHKMYVALCNEHCRKPASIGKYRLIFKEYGLLFLKQKGLTVKKSKPSNNIIKEKVVPIPNPIYQANHMNSNYIDSHQTISEYRPNGENLTMSMGISNNVNENLAVTSYLIGMDNTKRYDDKRIPMIDTGPIMGYTEHMAKQ